MDKQKIASLSLKIASSIIAADAELEKIATIVETIKDKGLVDVCTPLKKAGYKNVDVSPIPGGMAVMFKLRNGKTVVIASKKNVDKGEHDIEVGSYIVGYP